VHAKVSVYAGAIGAKDAGEFDAIGAGYAGRKGASQRTSDAERAEPGAPAELSIAERFGAGDRRDGQRRPDYVERIWHGAGVRSDGTHRRRLGKTADTAEKRKDAIPTGDCGMQSGASGALAENKSTERPDALAA